MKDYSTQHGKYAIIDHNGMYTIVQVLDRDTLDPSVIWHHKKETLSISKSAPTLQRQLDTWYDRESTPMATGMQRWKEAVEKQRKIRERVKAK